MTCRLADSVQVRKESWGLLFYHQKRHKMCFVKSGDWLYPSHFDGTWTDESITDDIARDSGAPAAAVKLVLLKLLQRLESGRLITHEVR